MGEQTTLSFAALVQRFFVEHLGQHRALSPRTIAAYRDTFRLLLAFAETSIGKAPSKVALTDLKPRLLLDFLDHLEKVRGNSVRSRNARLAALRTFLKYAGHHDLNALGIIEQALAIPMKRADRPLIGFLTRAEIQAVLNAPDDATWAGRRDRVLVSLMYNTGARVSEIIGIRCCDVVLEASPPCICMARGQGAVRSLVASDSGPCSAMAAIAGGSRAGRLPAAKPRRREDDPRQRHATAGSRRSRSKTTPSLSRGPLDLAPCDPAHDGNASAPVRCRYHRHRALAGA